MSYTRPAFDAANSSWVGAEAYSRPAFDAADANFQAGVSVDAPTAVFTLSAPVPKAGDFALVDPPSATLALSAPAPSSPTPSTVPSVTLSLDAGLAGVGAELELVTGGVISQAVIDGVHYVIHAFTRAGTAALTNWGDSAIEAEVLLVGGGSGPAPYEIHENTDVCWWGGGGGGEVIDQSISLAPGATAVVVGAGGDAPSVDGGRSSIAGVRAYGGEILGSCYSLSGNSNWSEFLVVGVSPQVFYTAGGGAGGDAANNQGGPGVDVSARWGTTWGAAGIFGGGGGGEGAGGADGSGTGAANCGGGYSAIGSTETAWWEGAPASDGIVLVRYPAPAILSPATLGLELSAQVAGVGTALVLPPERGLTLTAQNAAYVRGVDSVPEAQFALAAYLHGGNFTQPGRLFRAFGYSDVSTQLAADETRYVMSLGGDPPLRLPISSWQGTIKNTGSSYLQCVIPAATDWLAEVTARAAAGERFTILRQGDTRSGAPFEMAIASAPMGLPAYNRGPRRASISLSGYEIQASVDSESTTIIRPMRGVRSISAVGATQRMRCAIDWVLRPGMTAEGGGFSFRVDWISYIVNRADQYMDIGTRNV